MESAFGADTIAKVQEYVEKNFTESILPSIVDYIKIPNLSRSYDPEFLTNGLLQKAANHMIDWVKSVNVKGLKVELIVDEGRTPLIFIEVDGTKSDAETILLYGHFDKQPHMTGWKEGLGATTPVIRDDKLYGRGGADDGYAIYNSVMTIKAIQELGLAHPRCIIFIEGDEESGSVDLPYYFDKLTTRIGAPSVLICMDSGCGNYEQFWVTNTLRGMAAFDVKIKIIEEGVHSGDASGVVPDTFRILRQLLARLENTETGEVAKDLHVEIPQNRQEEAAKVVGVIGKQLVGKFPWVSTAKPVSDDELTCYLNRIWRPTLVVTGIDGLPPTATAGNVLRPETSFRISMRLPPTLDSTKAIEFVKKTLTDSPPYGAEVTILKAAGASGWNSPPSAQWFDDIINKSSQHFFGKDALYYGEGGSIPFINFLGSRYPQAKFVVTGILGPQSNAHGPNEFLHIPFTKKLLCCMIEIVAGITAHKN
jgi:acetylornithine deacetylase/succinyl-diaminopimelate desuccinylase-like protein